jgi:hypothetical protein
MPTDLAALLARKEEALREQRGHALVLPACFVISLVVMALLFASQSVANAFQLLVIG